MSSFRSWVSSLLTCWTWSVFEDFEKLCSQICPDDLTSFKCKIQSSENDSAEEKEKKEKKKKEKEKKEEEAEEEKEENQE